MAADAAAARGAARLRERMRGLIAAGSESEVFLYTAGAAVPDDVRHVRIDASVEVIGEAAFYDKKELKAVEICHGVTRVGYGAFQGCIGLEYALIPSSVEVIEECAFHGCVTLKEVHLSEGIRRMDDSAFEGCLGLVCVLLPSTVKVLSEKVFSACMQLQRVILCEGLKKIEDCAFEYCEALEYIELPSTLEEIGSSAFYSCLRLKKVQLLGGENLKKIDRGAFSWCSSLEETNIPDGIDIGVGAFRGCDKLKHTLCGYPKSIWRKQIIQLHGSILFGKRSYSDDEELSDNDSIATSSDQDDATSASGEFSDQVLQNVLPYLADRRDWNHLSLASNIIHQSMLQIQKNGVSPPWPIECKWPKDLSLPDDYLPHGIPRRLGKSVHGELDSFNPVWSRDGTQIAAVSNDCWLSRQRMIIHVVDQQVGHFKRWEGHDGAVITSLDFGDDFLVTIGYDRRVKKWACGRNYECIGDWDHLIPQTGNLFTDHHQGRTFPLKVSPDSCSVALLLKENLVVFDSSDGSIMHSIGIGDTIYPTSVPLFTPDGKSIIFGCANSYGEEGDEPSSDGFIKVWHIDENALHEVDLSSFSDRRESFASDLCLSKDGTKLVSCGTQLILWNVVEGRLNFINKLLEMEAVNEWEDKLPNDMTSTTFTPCENFVAVGGGERYGGDYGFLTFFNIDGRSSSSYNFSDQVSSIRYSSAGIGMYTSMNKTIINSNVTGMMTEDESEE